MAILVRFVPPISEWFVPVISVQTVHRIAKKRIFFGSFCATPVQAGYSNGSFCATLGDQVKTAISQIFFSGYGKQT
nr:hypothetical protein [uncultured Draconibacterium sp.]